MHIKTHSPNDTKIFMEMVNSKNTLVRIKRILRNKQSHARQIRSIRDLLDEGHNE